jgi:hypothetical protein
LHYSPQAPLRAWRLFRVRADEGGYVLSSPMYHNPEPPSWPQVGSEASCYEGHSPPAPGCRCGIYAAIAGTLDSLPGYLLDTVHDRDPWAYAEIACSGRVFVDMRGVRAERAEILRIALPETVWPDLTRSKQRGACSVSAIECPSPGSKTCRAGPRKTAAIRDRRATRSTSTSISTSSTSGRECRPHGGDSDGIGLRDPEGSLFVVIARGLTERQQS